MAFWRFHILGTNSWDTTLGPPGKNHVLQFWNGSNVLHCRWLHHANDNDLLRGQLPIGFEDAHSESGHVVLPATYYQMLSEFLLTGQAAPLLYLPFHEP